MKEDGGGEGGEGLEWRQALTLRGEYFFEGME